MAAFGRAIGIFCFMVVAGYILVAIVLPRPSPAAPQMSSGGQIAARQLTRQARFLVGHRTPEPAR